MHQATNIRIFVAHTQFLYRKGLCGLLSRQPLCHIVGDAADFTGSADEIERFAPDVVLYEASRFRAGHIAPQFPSHRILFLAEAEQAAVLAAEARPFVLRGDLAGTIANAVRTLAGRSNDGEHAGAEGLQALATATAASSLTALTPREHEIVRILAEGCTAREVAEELRLSVKTVEAHKLNLMRKLGIHNRAALIRYALDHSLIPAAAARS